MAPKRKEPAASTHDDDDMDFTTVVKPKRDYGDGVRSNIVGLKVGPGFGLQVKAPGIDSEEAGNKLKDLIGDELFVGTVTYHNGIKAEDSTYGRAKEPCVQVQVFTQKLLAEALSISAKAIGKKMAPTSGDWCIKTLTAVLSNTGGALHIGGDVQFLDFWFFSFKAKKPDLVLERVTTTDFKFGCNTDEDLMAWTHRQLVKLAERCGIELEDETGYSYLNLSHDSFLHAYPFLRSIEHLLTLKPVSTTLTGFESFCQGAIQPHGARPAANQCQNFDPQTQKQTKTCLCRDERGRRCTMHSWSDSIQIMSMLPPSFHRF